MDKQGLSKKIGPLPMWAWVLVIGGGVGLLWYLSSSGSSSSSSSAQNALNQVDPNNPMGLTYAQEQQEEAQGIDPNTGVPYNQEQQATLPSSSGTTVDRQTRPGVGLYQEARDILLARKELAKLYAPKTKKTSTARRRSNRVTIRRGSAFARYYREITGHQPPPSLLDSNWILQAYHSGIPARRLTEHRRHHTPTRRVKKHTHAKK